MCTYSNCIDILYLDFTRSAELKISPISELSLANSKIFLCSILQIGTRLLYSYVAFEIIMKQWAAMNLLCVAHYDARKEPVVLFFFQGDKHFLLALTILESIFEQHLLRFPCRYSGPVRCFVYLAFISRWSYFVFVEESVLPVFLILFFIKNWTVKIN